MLEEDSVQLSTIKASKFYNSFAEKIDKWEKALNGVSETVDLILNVQKKWMYLESIFMASEDICKQLPRESAIFMEVQQQRVQCTTETGDIGETKIRANFDKAVWLNFSERMTCPSKYKVSRILVRGSAHCTFREVEVVPPKSPSTQ